jgi:ubiquinone/menaquinone biosynthesis C-methylase UbiE
MNSAEYWDKRVSAHGHTGWSDWMIYGFDQLARQKAVQSVLTSMNPRQRNRALDFGSGTGDFASLLSRSYADVLAFDISEKALEVAKAMYGRNKKIAYYQADAIWNLPLADESFDLVLSVTVLNHIMDDEVMRSTLAYLARKLEPDGRFLALEYSPPIVEGQSSNYQRFLTFAQWKEHFGRSGFALDRYYGFYHPMLAPCKSYDAYSRNIGVRLLCRLGDSALNRQALKFVAKLSLLGRNDFLWEGNESDVMRLMVFRKA